MKVIRFYGEYQLLHEPLQNMYRVTDGLNYSLWLYSEDKYELMDLSNYDFEEKCKELIEISLLD